MNHRKQLSVFFTLLAIHALSVFITYTFFIDQLAASAGTQAPDMGVTPAVLGLANVGIVLVLYGALGLAGYWFARKLGLPGIFSEDGNWRRWILIPLALGILGGTVLIGLDNLFAPINGFGHFPHPAFPTSLFASLSAGIGEEILFRGFVFGLWGLILNWLFKKLNGRTAALWLAMSSQPWPLALGTWARS
jgi:membrane protease YdiL (CAAX protease family)